MSHRSFVRVAALGAAGATALVAAPNAFAAATPATHGAHQVSAAIMKHESHRLHGLSRRTNTDEQSTNWSGYAATGSSGAYTSVSSSWVQPSVSCSSGETSYSAFWVGLDGFSNSALEQTGTEADCINGQAEYGAWWEVLPAAETSYSVTVDPGDSLSASVVYNGNSTFTMTLTDSTQGWTKTTTADGSSGFQNASAEVIAEAPEVNGSIANLADFGTVNFSADADGNALGNYSPDEITMIDNSGATRAQPSAISGSSFSDTWEASS
jgi:hypothetical protein